MSGRDGVDTTALAEAPTWPALRDQLPAGSVRDRVAPAMWIRAVAAVIETTSVTHEVVARNADDKIVARIRWHETIESGPSAGAPLIRVALTPLGGYAKDADRIARLLMASGSFGVPERTLTEELLAHAGPANNGQGRRSRRAGRRTSRWRPRCSGSSTPSSATATARSTTSTPSS